MPLFYFEGSPIVTPFTIESRQNAFSSDSVNLKHNRKVREGQRWELRFKTINDPSQSVDQLVAAVSRQHSSSTMVMPQLTYVMEDADLYTGALAVGTTATEGSTTVALGAGLSASAVLPKSSFVKFDNHSKVYIVVERCNDNTLSIWPKLVEAVPSGTAVLHAGGSSPATFQYYRATENLPGIVFTDGVLSDSGLVTLIEDK